MNLRTFLDTWLLDQRPRLQLSTWESYTVYVRLHLMGYFPAELELEELTPTMIQNYVSDKLQRGRADGNGGLGYASVYKHLAVLRQALNDAVNLGLLRFNPAASIRKPRKSFNSRQVGFLTLSEAKSLLFSLENDDLYPIVLLTLYYGLRRSEVLGLKWCNIDFNRESFTVCHTVVKNLTIEAKDSTKTLSSNRTFKLLPEVIDVLLQLRRSSPDSTYVFHRSDGSPLRPDSLYRQFKRAAARAGFDMTFHHLRHSTASILFDLGWQLEDVREWLGHSDIETTSNIYLHYLSSRKVLKADSLIGLLR